MRTPTILALGLASFTACVGASDDSDDNNADQVDTGGKADGSVVYPQGIYNDTSSFLDGNLSTVTLSMDMTFSRTTEGVDCVEPNGSCGTSTGTYTFSHSGSTHYIRFLDSTGTLINRYAFKATDNGDKLQLRQTGVTEWFDLTNVDTKKLGIGDKCADDKDNLLGQCPANFGCEYDSTNNNEQDCCPEY